MPPNQFVGLQEPGDKINVCCGTVFGVTYMKNLTAGLAALLISTSVYAQTGGTPTGDQGTRNPSASQAPAAKPADSTAAKPADSSAARAAPTGTDRRDTTAGSPDQGARDGRNARESGAREERDGTARMGQREGRRDEMQTGTRETRESTT